MTNQEYAAKMIETLSGQEGIVAFDFGSAGDEAPQSLGALVNVEAVVTNMLLTFERDKVLLFVPLAMISTVEDQAEDGSFRCKKLCTQLFIGGKTLGKVLSEIHPD